MERYKFLQNPSSRIRAVEIAQVYFECSNIELSSEYLQLSTKSFQPWPSCKQSVHRPVLLNKGPGTSRGDGSSAFQVHNALVSCE